MSKKGIRRLGRNALQAIDMFSFDVSFRENRNDRFTTWFGCIPSVFVIVVVGSYSLKKFETLRTYGDTSYQEVEILSEEK